MTTSESGRDRFGWAAALAVGTWAAVGISRWLVQRWADVATPGAGRPGEPVREIVLEALAEHQHDDRPIVQAFEEALETEESEAQAGV